MYLNNSVNFLLYCIGGETFKEEFLVMCGCHKRLSAREKVIEQAKKDREERLKEREKALQKEESDLLKALSAIILKVQTYNKTKLSVQIKIT